MIKKRRLLTLLFALNEFFTVAKTIAGSTNFLDLNPGARPAGMGSAFTGLADDSNAPLFNPAGLTNMGLSQFELGASIVFLSQDRINSFLTASQQLPPKSYLGFQVVQFGTSSIEGFDNDALPTSNLQDTELAFATSYAYEVDYHLKLGVNGSFIYQNLAGINARGFGGLDAGLLIVPSVLYDFTLGVCIRHLGSFLTWDSGTTTHSDPNFRIGFSQKFSSQTLVLAYDAEWPMQTNLNIVHHVGFEWSPKKFFTVRGGWNKTDPTAGLSIRHLNYSLEYAYQFKTNGLGDSQHLTVNMTL